MTESVALRENVRLERVVTKVLTNANVLYRSGDDAVCYSRAATSNEELDRSKSLSVLSSFICTEVLCCEDALHIFQRTKLDRHTCTNSKER